jgi:predicted transcriptional regulator
MEHLGLGTHIVTTLRRYKSLPVQLLARLAGSDPAELQPYLEDLARAGVVVLTEDRVTMRAAGAAAR